MKKNIELHILIAGVCALLFMVLMALVAAVDVQPIGPMDTTIGLANLNAAVRDALPYRSFVYLISEVLGLAALLTPVYFALMGLQQLKQTKRLKTVDPDLYILAATYVLLAVFYVFFELCVLNYRPILVDGELEASFPSSHTMLSITLLGTAASQFSHRMGSTKQGKNAVILCYSIMAAIVLTRILSGVHWLTDILGGLLLGTMLLQFYTAAIAALEGQTLRFLEDADTAVEDAPASRPVASAPKRKLISVTSKKLPRVKLPKRYTPKH